MNEVTITVPKALVTQFLKLAEKASDTMGNAGCNDWEMEDTPENRELADLVQARNYHMTLEEYCASDKYIPYVEHHPLSLGGNKLLCWDFCIFDLFVGAVKSASHESKNMVTKLKIYVHPHHDHVVGFIDDKEVFSNDYSYENVLRIAGHLGWEVEIVPLSSDEFEDKFA